RSGPRSRSSKPRRHASPPRPAEPTPNGSRARRSMSDSPPMWPMLLRSIVPVRPPEVPMLAPRNLLKSNATTFDRLLRLVDPLVIVIVGWGSYLIYLGSAVPPSNYGVALLGIAVFPETGLYQPKRGASLADDLRALTYGWSVVVALGIMVAFLTK